MSNELPPTWSRERTDGYRPTPNADRLRFATYRRESAGVELRVAPATFDATERPGYALTAITSVDTRFEDRTLIATTTTFEGCTRLAREFVHQFDDAYDGAATARSAVEAVEPHVRSSLTLGVTASSKRRAE